MAELPKYKWLSRALNKIKSASMPKGIWYLKQIVGEVKELKPYTYQIINGEKKEIACAYRWQKGILSFIINEKEIDSSKPLVIDPTVVFSTYTGSTQDNWGFTATYDNNGNAYGGGIIYSGFTFLQYPIGSTGILL